MPPPKLSVAGEDTLNVPLSVPPPANCNVPVTMLTVPELLKTTLTLLLLLLAPEDLVKVPELLKAGRLPTPV